MIDSHILDITEGHEEDESIRSCQYHQYSPITGTQLNQPGEIRIAIENQDKFFHLHTSYLVFNSKLKPTTGDYETGKLVALINNAMMYLFSGIK